MSSTPPGSAPAPTGDASQEKVAAPLNVMVVDDSAVMRSMVIRALKMTGLPLGDIHQASDGNAALAILDEHWIDLATVDIHMAGMGGAELVTRLRATPETAALPIVVISSEGSETRIREIEETGAGFLRKPFEPAGLRSAVLRVLKIEGHA